jgi:hypothetical protein
LIVARDPIAVLQTNDATLSAAAARRPSISTASITKTLPTQSGISGPLQPAGDRRVRETGAPDRLVPSTSSNPLARSILPSPHGMARDLLMHPDMSI